ncbi:hypothetical protein CJP74_03705 [Psittacicella melopsittaci]|uniref:Solute-binding protein family 5 domain-containing protein n=1 Tax=Psittacicella melopsittaci TaxID=2028576 RepID=A0A3A1Y5H5_9GAMM|nr:peptide ABC transporter substrate-binding protein [Psittacicella melopsittaci]RIY32721.1 hypothetical protein CJP74_03705 [Psittacicella melopsittaci]
MIKWFCKGLSLTLVAASMLATQNSFAANVPQGTKLADKQVLYIELADNPPTLDPNLITDTIGSQLTSNLFDLLTTYDEHGNLTAGIAQSWSHSDDFTVWTFKLQRNATWSDGVAVTAHDFVTSWQRLVDPKTASEYSFYLGDLGVKNARAIIEGKVDKSQLGVRAVDDYTLEVTLETPVPWFLDATTRIVLAPVPTHLVKAGTWPNFDNYVTNGPYLLKTAVPNEKYVIVKNEKYWNAKNTVITEANFMIIRNANDAYKRLQAGDLHAFKLSTPAIRTSLEKDNNYKILEAPGSYTIWYGFSLSRPPFDDLRVRRAVLLAINTQDLQNKVFRNSVQATSVYASKALPGVADNLKQAPYFDQPYEQRLKEARELLAQAGYNAKNPLKFEIAYNTNEMYKMSSIAIQAQLRQAFGNAVQTTLTNAEWSTFLSNRQRDVYTFYRSGWGADYYEPSTFYGIWTSDNPINRSKFNSPEYDKLWQDLFHTKTVEQRFAIYQKMNDILIREAPAVPIFSPLDSYATVKNLQGLVVDNNTRRVFNMYFTAE